MGAGRHGEGRAPVPLEKADMGKLAMLYNPIKLPICSDSKGSKREAEAMPPIPLREIISRENNLFVRLGCSLARSSPVGPEAMPPIFVTEKHIKGKTQKKQKFIISYAHWLWF